MLTAPYGKRDVTLFLCDGKTFSGYYHTFRVYSKSFDETNKIKKVARRLEERSR